MNDQREITLELDAIRTRASELQAKLLNAKTAEECTGLSNRLAELHERYCALTSRLQRLERLTA